MYNHLDISQGKPAPPVAIYHQMVPLLRAVCNFPFLVGRAETCVHYEAYLAPAGRFSLLTRSERLKWQGTDKTWLARIFQCHPHRFYANAKLTHLGGVWGSKAWSSR